MTRPDFPLPFELGPRASPAVNSRLSNLRKVRLIAAGLIGGTLVAALLLLPDGRASAQWTPDIEHVSDPQRTDFIDAPFAPTAIRPLSPDKAEAWNASIPIVAPPTDFAKPFFINSASPDMSRSADCLTAAIYYEAGREPVAGQQAVAQVVLNRVRHPAFPKTVCGVIFQGSERPTGCQFTFTCDGALSRKPAKLEWDRARSIAEAALNGFVYAPIGLATHYHANYVVPYWAASLDKVAYIGAHVFYKWHGAAGERPSFGQAYAGEEPIIASLPSGAGSAEGAPQAQQASPPLARTVIPNSDHAVSETSNAVGNGRPLVNDQQRWIVELAPKGV